MSKSELHKELIELKQDVLNMGNLALKMLHGAISSLNTRDFELAKDIMHEKHKLREYDADIEERTLKLIALYQPMAIDLRRIACILKTITYLTRIGRYGKDIAGVVYRNLSERKDYRTIVNIQHIYEHVNEMISLALEAFEKSDISYIKDFGARDDEVDKLRWAIFRECITYMMEDPKCITPCAHFIMFARYLERCGDHACKIAEKVHYMVTGEHTEIK
jgi:phosphate transport system protein